jgi:hypothetical protein
MNAVVACAAFRRSRRYSKYSLETSLIHNGPEEVNDYYFERALCNVRRWLRDGRAAECHVDIAVLADILAPPSCYNGCFQSLDGEEKAVYQRILCGREETKQYENVIVGCRLTGSNAEGLTIIGDDDYMWIATNMIGDVIPTQFAGYYHIKKSRRMVLDEELIPNNIIKNWLFSLNDNSALIHGPAVTSQKPISRQTEDNIMTLQWNKWPSDIDRQVFTTELYGKLRPFVK